MDVQKHHLSYMGKTDDDKRKIVEARVGDLNKHIGMFGKIVKIIFGDKYLLVKVRFIRHYDTLEEYVQAEGWKNVAPFVNSYEECIKEYLQVTTIKDSEVIRVFDEKRIEKLGGINALHLKLLSTISTVSK